MIKIESFTKKSLIDLYKEKNVGLEGNITKLIDFEDDDAVLGRRQKICLLIIACASAFSLMGACMAGGVKKSAGEPVEMTASSAAHRIHAARKQILNAVKPCEETYGLFPCSSSLTGSIFLTGAYGLLLLSSALI